MREFETEVATADGTLDAFVCHPEEGGPFPAVVMYMDAPGIRAYAQARRVRLRIRHRAAAAHCRQPAALA